MPRRRRSDALPKHDPLREAIATHAYERFLERGGEHGHDVEDWIAAENDLLDRRQRPRRKPQDDESDNTPHD
jgi:hypothetical protein